MNDSLEDKSMVLTIQQRFSDSRCQQVESYLSLLANPLRFHILCALTFKPFSVGELVDLCKSNLSNTSQQLKLLRLAGIISMQRKGKSVYYKLEDPRIVKLLDELEEIFTPSEGTCPEV